MKDISGIEGKVALVTGAAQGIGAAVTKALAGLGATVAALDRQMEGLHELSSKLTEQGRHVVPFALDVTDSRAVEEAVALIESELGPIEILVNVAGVLIKGFIEELSDEDWENTFAVNTTGVFHISRSVVKRMAQRNGGAIVTVGSNAAKVPRMQMSAYVASKAAAAMFTKCLALEYASCHIRCNIVSPGSTNTTMLHQLWGDQGNQESTIAGTPESFRIGIPLGRVASPEDIADGVVFLVSDRAKHITMHDLCIDGGATLGC
ncbi:2,3-dihydro-2,3-dihydroxybenzoate dehydrogenase [compost metagenome]